MCKHLVVLTAIIGSCAQYAVNKICRLKRLKDSRRALEQFDKASSSRLKTAINELQMHCQLLRMVKQDMDHIYRRIRCSHPHCAHRGL